MSQLNGDFNAVRGDGVLTLFTQHGWEVPVKQGDPATVPSGQPRQEIDFVMIQPAASLKVLKNSVLAEAVFSDHRAVLVEVARPAP